MSIYRKPCPECSILFDDKIGVYYVALDGTRLCSDACRRTHNTIDLTCIATLQTKPREITPDQLEFEATPPTSGAEEGTRRNETLLKM